MHRSTGKSASKASRPAFDLDEAVDQLLRELPPQHEQLLRMQFQIGSQRRVRKTLAGQRDALRASLRALRYQAMNAARRSCRQIQPRPNASHLERVEGHGQSRIGRSASPAPERRAAQA